MGNIEDRQLTSEERAKITRRKLAMDILIVAKVFAGKAHEIATHKGPSKQVCAITYATINSKTGSVSEHAAT